MRPRKTLPKTAVPRMYFIDQEIASGKYPNVPEMAKKYETSISSINRDIAYMRDMMHAPIKYDFFNKGFYYSESTFRLSASYASEDDLLALGMVKSLLDLYRDTPIHDSALNLMENISVPLGNSENTDWYRNRIIVPKSITVQVDPSVWKHIVTGLQQNRVISFYYNNSYSEESFRRVHPYQLLFDRSAWYLYCYDENTEEKRIFALARISRAELEKESFTLNEDFDYRSSEGQSYFGIFKGIKTHKFEIEIKGSALWILERRWAEDQKIEKTPDGIILSFTSNQYDRVLYWILSQGAEARPLAPKELVDNWKEIIKNMYELAYRHGE